MKHVFFSLPEIYADNDELLRGFNRRAGALWVMQTPLNHRNGFSIGDIVRVQPAGRERELSTDVCVVTRLQPSRCLW